MARIAIILGRLVIGGTTMDTLQVAQALQHQHEVLLITGGGDKDEFEAAYLTEHLPGIRQERINGFSGSIHTVRDLRAWWQIRKVIRRFSPHIVHTHTAKAGLLGRLAAAAERVPMVVHTYHGLMFSGYYGPAMSKLVIQMERWLASKTHRVIALSQMQKAQLVEQYRICKAEKVAIVPLGINLRVFEEQLDAKRREFREKYLLQPGEVAIGIVGRIVPVKNHSLFIQVAGQLTNEKKLPARFFIIGDGPLRRRLFAEAKARQINFTYFPEDPRQATLTFTSWVTEVDKAMAGLDVVVLTSLNEGTPVSLMEAQACGVPVVATRAGGIDDIVQHSVTGYTIDQNQPQLLAEKLEELILDPKKRQEMGAKGQAFARLHFRKDRQVADLNRIYLEAIQS
jgi:glycosyltransferase involved in cell wall biosynthesis